MMEEKAIKNKYDPDIKLFLLLIPFIAAFNYYLTYSNIQFNNFLLLTFTIDTLQGYLAWWVVRTIILKLDLSYPYDPNPTKRIVIQVILTTFLGLLVIILSTELLSFFVKGTFAPMSFYTLDVLIISIWFLVINGIYIGLHYHYSLRQIQKEAKKLNSEFPGFLVSQGKQEILVKAIDTGLLRIDGDYVQLLTKNGKKFLLNESLDFWEKQLPEHEFFRINRQTILHRGSISGYKKLENGKLQAQLLIEVDISIELGISRAKAPSFRAWFLPKA